MRFLNDGTDPQAEAALLTLLRASTPERRVELALSLTDAVRAMARGAIARAHPEWDERRCAIEFARVQYGDDLAKRIDRHLSGHGR